MKIKTLLSAILVMALCIGVIAGSTFALFTDSTELDIAVTSGNVEVDATLSLVATYSAVKGEQATYDKYLVDEYKKTYNHVKQDDFVFSNGGDVVCDGEKITISRITPGDKVEAMINVTNVGDVAMIYRYTIVVDASEGVNNKLANGMVLTTDKEYEQVLSYTSEWSAPVVAKAGTIPHPFSLELPVYAGNEYQSEEGDIKGVSYKIIVEAVQANADKETDVNYEHIFTVKNQEQLQKALDSTTSYPYNAFGFNVVGDINGNVTVEQRKGVKYTIYGNGYTFDGELTVDGKSARYDDTALTIKDFNFKSANAKTGFIYLGINNATRYTSNVTIENCTFDDVNNAQTVACIRTSTGGDHNLTVKNCLANKSTHSLLQVDNIEKGLTVTGCKVYSKNGINLNSTPYLNMSDCTFEVSGYAVRVGQSNAKLDKVMDFNITNCTLSTTTTDAEDAVIIFRGDAVRCVMNLVDVNFIHNATTSKFMGNVEGETVIHNY